MARILFVAFAATAAGCFALFPLDDYGPGDGEGDSGGRADAPSSSSSSSGSLGDSAPDPNQRLVFITSMTTDGELLSAQGGYDSLCSSLAADAGLGGTFKAWLSSGGRSVIARFFNEAGPPPDVNYVDLHGRPIAKTWQDLLGSGEIENPIEYDEKGDKVSSQELDASAGSCSGAFTPVWSATYGDGGVGEKPQASCDDWTTNSSSVSGRVGLVGDQPGTWTFACSLPCNLQAHLYCFQQ